MKKIIIMATVLFIVTPSVFADTFGMGENQFTIEFVTISGDSGDLGSWPAGIDYMFSGVNHGDYHMGTFEITNDQWNKFKASVGGTVTGFPSTAYNQDTIWPGANVPTNGVSWFEAAQFVNWLNTSTSHQAAYKFTGTQGQSDYKFALWESGDTGYDASNPNRNSNAYYFLPTEDEWIKAAYWDGIGLQTYATVGDVSPTQAGWNFLDNGFATDPRGPWNVGSGSEELNGTFDMMGNVWELMESPYYPDDYLPNYYSQRVIRGGSYWFASSRLRKTYRLYFSPHHENYSSDHGSIGFRVASVTPEPTTLLLLSLGSIALIRKS